jgi:NADH dehydrogenase
LVHLDLDERVERHRATRVDIRFGSVTQDGHPVPGVAQAAIQQGRFVGHIIANRVRGRKDGPPFRYRNKGNMAVVGKNFAILEAGYLRSSGFVTWLVWAALRLRCPA